jgi:hypothetical protein
VKAVFSELFSITQKLMQSIKLHCEKVAPEKGAFRLATKAYRYASHLPHQQKLTDRSNQQLTVQHPSIWLAQYIDHLRHFSTF